MKVATFAGTVIDCRTRFKIDKSITAYVTHFDANWILTMRIESAGDGVPIEIGEERSFMIHSPVQLLFDPAEDCVGKRYDLVVEIDDSGKARWQTLRHA
ncbi:MAG TPA: hypothetical protein VGO00_04995 [Kofleriaceae bacterium]|nr:hypothetical protein [Kofleriaceae bacterium]